MEDTISRLPEQVVLLKREKEKPVWYVIVGVDIENKIWHGYLLDYSIDNSPLKIKKEYKIKEVSFIDFKDWGEPG